MKAPFSRRDFVLSGSALLVAQGALQAKPNYPTENIGPLLGHVDATSAVLWGRFSKLGKYVLELAREGGEKQKQTATAAAKSDGTARWQFNNLVADANYQFKLVDGGENTSGIFRTAKSPETPTVFSLAFGSCALEDEGSREVWQRMLTEKVDGLLLGGDTPYIDRTDLPTQRQRYREFNSVPEFQQLTRSVPCWGTWDDHDFGKNGTNGKLPGKENALQAFKEYRGLASFGDGKEGIYTSFRRGPMEVFVIDARWFAGTAPSPVDRNKPTLLGEAQWRWLQERLLASTAPFKILATGIIWDDKQNGETDDWETYAHERAALFNFIREHRISGVILLGGDIHVSRVLKYPAEETVGYPLYQFISSPIHHKVIEKLNVPHPHLTHSAVHPNTFLKLTCDTTLPEPTATARFIDKGGKRLFEEIVIRLSDLQPKS